MRRSGQIKNNLTKGALDPKMAQRLDLKHYYQAAKEITNMVVLPQGGAVDRSGLRSRFRVRHKLQRVPLVTANLTANAGTAAGSALANCVDQNSATEWLSNNFTAPSVGTDVLLMTIALGSDTDVSAVDIIGFRGSIQLKADDAFGVFVRDAASVLHPLGGRVNLRDVDRTRRFSSASGLPVRGTSIEIRLLAATTAASAVAIHDLRVFTESPNLSAVKRVPFTFGLGQSYTIILSDRNADICLGPERVASAPIPHRSEQLADVGFMSKSDTLVLFHPDVQPAVLFRQGAHDEWDAYAQEFTNVPSLVAGTSFGAAQDEVQLIEVGGIAAGAKFSLSVEDLETAPVTYAANAASMQSAIAAALAALPNVASGIAVTVLEASANLLRFQVRFSGAGNTARVWPPIFFDVPSLPAATISTVTLQDGRPSTGAVMSNQSGWPRCGCFFQGRAIYGGMKLRPETIVGSAVDAPFNLFQSTTAANAGFDYSLDSDELAVVQSLFAGRHLQIFTESSEWYLDNRSIDATQPLNFVQTTRYGARGGISPVQVDGGTQFVQASGNVIRDFVYSDAEQDYIAGNVTLFASQLFGDIRDIAYRRASETSEGNQIFAVNGDGTLAVIVMLRAQEILAVSQFVTDGKFLGVNVDASRRVYALVERTANSVTEIYFEEFAPDAYLDASQVVTQAASVTVPGLTRLAGKTVWAVADGDLVGPLTVSLAGVLTLPAAASVIEVGLPFDARIRGLPHLVLRQDGSVDLSPRRIHGAELYVRDTTSVRFGANGQATEAVPLLTFGMTLLDQAPLDNPVTGNFTVEGIKGKMPGPDWVAERVIPGRLEFEAVYLEAG
ncbi:MAG: hypothetical protein ACRCS9_13950 [Hyphomicrobium sp.]